MKKMILVLLSILMVGAMVLSGCQKSEVAGENGALAGEATKLIPKKTPVDGRVGCEATITKSVVLSSNDPITKVTCPNNGLTIAADNIVLDCAGYTIKGVADTTDWAGWTGISISGNNKGIIIKNCYINNFDRGMWINRNAQKITIERNNFKDNEFLAIDVEGPGDILEGNEINIKYNIFENNGIELRSISDDIIVQKNNFLGDKVMVLAAPHSTNFCPNGESGNYYSSSDNPEAKYLCNEPSERWKAGVGSEK